MTKRITIQANGDLTFQDYRGLQGILSGSVPADGTKSFDLTNEQWNAVRPVFVKLSQHRVELIEGGLRTGRYAPLMRYMVDTIPGGRPRVHQIEGTISLAGAAQTLVLRGENLIQGFNAQAVVKKNTTSQVTLVAARKGPIGDKVSVKINGVPTVTNAGSVTVTRRPHGGALIEVTPPDVGTSATGGRAADIVAQINAVDEAARFVAALGDGVGLVGPVDTASLSGGDGAGIALLDVQTAVAGSYLRIESRVPGNGRNSLSVKVLAPGVAGIVMTDEEFVVTPAAAGAGPQIGAIATQINAHVDARRYVKATAIGTTATPLGVAGTNYLYGGSGDDVEVTIGGASVRVTDYTDTAVTGVVEGAGGNGGLGGAGLLVGEQALVAILSDYGVIQAGQLIVIT